MLKLFGPAVVQFFEMNGSLLTFYSSKSKKLDSALKIRIKLLDYKTSHVDVPLTVVHCQSSGRGYLCQGRIDLSAEHLMQLENLLYRRGVRPDLGEEGRRSPRLLVSLKALSHDITGYHCVAMDLSHHGVSLNCQDQTVVGRIVNLVLETDVNDPRELKVTGRVISCSEYQSGKNRAKAYKIGIDFVGMKQAQVDMLTYYMRIVAGRLKCDVMTRQIADGELTSHRNQSDVSFSLPNLPPPPPPAV